MAGDFVDRGAVLIGACLQLDQFADRIDGKAELSRLPDEAEPLDSVGVIKALAAFAAVRLSHQADGFIVADRGDLDASEAGEASDCKRFHGPVFSGLKL